MNIQLTLDRTAVGLSLLCGAHCFLLPVLMLIFSGVTPFSLNNEVVHRWLLMGTLPVSVLALTMGCRKHKRYRVYVLGGFGLALLCLTGYLGCEHLGELGEKMFSLLAVVIIASGHILNHRLCREQDCECSADLLRETSGEWSLS